MTGKIRVAVIGHKDHGKSTLIGRMLFERGLVKPDRLSEVAACSAANGGRSLNFAFLLDTFEEERTGGLTIDTVQVEIPGPKNGFVFIDCPGHRELVKNMLTGASAADAALLVVSADRAEGIQEQTRGHVRLARGMGIARMVVAVTKMDTAGYREARFRQLAREIRKILGREGYKSRAVPLVPVSAVNGGNILRASKEMGWYRGKPLARTLEARFSPARPPMKTPLRVTVQDVYAADGKAFVVGKVESGVLRKGEEVVFQPSGKRGKVTLLRSGSRAVACAVPGAAIGFSLAAGPDGIRRGEVCSAASSPAKPAKAFEARLFPFEDISLRPGASFAVYCGTAVCRGVLKEVRKEDSFYRVRFSLAGSMVIEPFALMPPLGKIVIAGTRAAVAAGIVTRVTK
ncbi:MAG: GTP-binding protein [Endomicrobiales bacterium]